MSSMRCMVPCVGKGVTEITVVSRSFCGMELRRSSIARSPPRGPIVCREKEVAFTHPQFVDYIVGARWTSDETYIYNDEKYRTPGTTPDFSCDTTV